MSEFFDQSQDNEPIRYMDECPCCQANFLQYNKDDKKIDSLCIEIGDEEWQAQVKCGDCGYAEILIFSDAEMYAFDALQARANRSIKSDIKTFENLEGLGEQKAAIRLTELLVEEGFLPPLQSMG